MHATNLEIPTEFRVTPAMNSNASNNLKLYVETHFPITGSYTYKGNYKARLN